MTAAIRWCFGRARMTALMALVAVILGWSAYQGLPRQGSPEIDIPLVVVSVAAPGMTAGDVETAIVMPLETELFGLPGLKVLRASAKDDNGLIRLEFNPGWDEAAVLSEIERRVDRAILPDAAETPRVATVDFSAAPILTIAVIGRSGADEGFWRLDRRILAESLARRLEAEPSLRSATIRGMAPPRAEVWPDPARLAAHGLSPADVARRIQALDRLAIGGAADIGGSRMPLSLESAIDSIDALVQAPALARDGKVVRVGDLARIGLFPEEEERAWVNGAPALLIDLAKNPSASILEATAAAMTIMGEIELPDDLDIRALFDSSTRIEGMIGQMEMALTLASLLVGTVLWIALGLRPALLVASTAPVSFMLAFALFGAFGLPINTMVMFGMILSVGLLVDAGVVVAEAAERRLDQGEHPAHAWREAAVRMAWPIAASTATTLAAFLPLLFWPGIAGQFMRLLPITLVFVLSASFIAAVFVMPVLGATMTVAEDGIRRILGRPRQGSAVDQGQADRTESRWVDPASLPLRRPLWGLGLLVAVLVTSGGVIALYAQNNQGVAFFVDTEPDSGILSIQARGGLSPEAKATIVARVDKAVGSPEGIAYRVAEPAGDRAGQDAIGQIRYGFTPWRDRPLTDQGVRLRATDALEEALARAVANEPGLRFDLRQVADGPADGKPVDIEITARSGPVLEAAMTAARRVFDHDSRLVRIEDTRPAPEVAWRLDIDRRRLAEIGIGVDEPALAVAMIGRGARLAGVRMEGLADEIAIVARMAPDQRRLAAIAPIPLGGGAGGQARLDDVLRASPEPATVEIARLDGARTASLRADLAQGARLDIVLEDLMAPLDAAISGAGATWRLAGDQQDQEDSQRFLSGAFLVALGLIFVILLAAFNSIYASLLVLTAVLFSGIGVLIGLLVMDQTFSVIMSGVGVLALAGIVVNNNIVLIDSWRENRLSMDDVTAARHALATRTRPVLLTSLTTGVGLVPMLLGISFSWPEDGSVGALLTAIHESLTGQGAGALAGYVELGAPESLWWIPVATAIVFGLGFSTVITLMLTPALLTLRHHTTRSLAGLLVRHRELFATRRREAAHPAGVDTPSP